MTTGQPNAGRIARRGFRYQDLCALRYCIAAAHLGPWTEVYHEYGDDVMLVAEAEGRRRVRFVQVKHEEEARSHWSVARLTRADRPGGAVGDSIVGRLFGRDQGDANTEFRLAINEGVDTDLQPLHYRWTQMEPSVDLSWPGAVKLLQALREWSPPQPRGIDFYVAAFLLEQHSNEIADMDARVHSELAAMLRDRDLRLLEDEIAEVLDSLFVIVYRSGSDDEKRPGESARIVVDEFLRRALHEAEVRRIRTEMIAANPHANLRLQLERAGLEADEAERAMALRQAYYTTWIRVRGTREGEDLDGLLAEVQALTAAVSREAEIEGANEADTLARQLSELRRLYNGEGGNRPSRTAELIQGMFYFVLSRGGDS